MDESIDWDEDLDEVFRQVPAVKRTISEVSEDEEADSLVAGFDIRKLPRRAWDPKRMKIVQGGRGLPTGSSVPLFEATQIDETQVRQMPQFNGESYRAKFNIKHNL